MASPEVMVPQQVVLRNPNADEANRLIVAQAQRPDRTITCIKSNEAGKIIASSTSIPYQESTKSLGGLGTLFEEVQLASAVIITNF